MKHIILLAVLLSAGCATVDHNGDTADMALVREYVTTEVYRIQAKRDTTESMYKAGKLSEGDYIIMLDRIATDERGIVARARARFN